MKEKTIVFDSLPQNVTQLKVLAESSLLDPFDTAALTLVSLCRFGENRDDGVEMLNFLKGPQPLNGMQINFLRDRFMNGKKYIPYSYFDGSSPGNGYTPSKPYTVTFFDDPYSYSEENYVKLNVRSSGADSPRQVKLRCKGEQWFLFEQYLMVGIRLPEEKDPWA